MTGTGGIPILRRRTTAEEVASVLRDMIMDGTVKPGTQLREEALSDQFDVSRRTIRDALGVLAHERVVRHYRHKGSRVVQFTEEDIRDLYRVRKTLEGAAARGVRQTTDQQVERLTTAFENLRDATRSRRPKEIVLRDLEFHQAIVGLLDSDRVNAFFSDVAVEMLYALSILESTYQESASRSDEALDEHRAIYAAFVDRDAKTAARLVYEHAHVNEQLLVEAIALSETASVEA
jgi:DNA-binding GntR family transcriptional regulator